MTPERQRSVLVASHSWSATPWDYSSLRTVQFGEDGRGLAIYGYGQTIYAKIDFLFDVPDAGVLRQTLLPSPAFQFFKGFTPEPGREDRQIRFTLTEEPAEFVESVTGARFGFSWRLDLDTIIYPDGLSFPYDPPRTFYGYRERCQDPPKPADDSPPRS